MKKTLLCIIFITMLWPSTTFADDFIDNAPAGLFRKLADLDMSTMERLLEKGEIVLINKPEGGVKFKTATAISLIDASQEECWAAITDYDHYKEFMPQIKESKVVEKTDQYVLVKYSLWIQFFSVFGTGADYVLKVFHQPNSRIYFLRESGDFKEIYGSWELVPVDNGSRTIAFYTLYSDLRSLSWLANIVLKKQPDLEQAVNVMANLTTVIAMKKRIDEVKVQKTNQAK